MVTPATAAAKVEIELESIRLMLGDLPEVAQEWAELGDGERASWSLDWDQVMGGLDVTLDPAFRAGKMTADQQSRYRKLLRTLKDALPTLQRLDLANTPSPTQLERGQGVRPVPRGV